MISKESTSRSRSQLEWINSHLKPHDLLYIKTAVPVFEGENLIEIVAWNSGVPKADRSLESAQMVAFVRVAIPPEAPEIVIERIRAFPDSGQFKDLIVDPNSPNTYRSLWPDVELIGGIKGKSKISRAEILLDGVREPFNGFIAKTNDRFDFSQKQKLKPGPQTIVAEAAVDGANSEKRIHLIYEPQLPKILSMTATSKLIQQLPQDAPKEENIFYAGYHQQMVTITAELSGQLNDCDRVSMRVNQVPIAPNSITMNRQQQPQTITAQIPLIGGSNTVSLRVENDWAQAPPERALEITFRRPPEISLMEAKALLIDEPLDIRCRIASLLPIRSAKIIIDGKSELSVNPSEIQGDPGHYSVEMKDIGLEAGMHVIEVFAKNDEGETLVPVRHQVTVEQKTIEAPAIELESNFAEQSKTRNVDIAYRVTSSVPVQVQMKIRGKFEEAVPIVQEINEFKDDKTQRTISGMISGTLFDGTNDVELTASSIGGFSKKEFKISYTTLSTNIEILSVNDLTPEIDKDDNRIYRMKGWSAPESRVKLRGRVTMRDGLTTGGNLKAKILVNALFQTAPIHEIERTVDGAVTGTFVAELTLTKSKNNEIKIQVYDDERTFPTSFENYKRLFLDCLKHEHGQDLYLVLLGTGDSATLFENAKSVLRIKADPSNQNNGRWASELFSSVRIVDGLNKDATAVSNRLTRLVTQMDHQKRDRNFATGSHAIVMIYFQGKLRLKSDDVEFVTETAQSPNSPHYSGKELVKTLKATYGAHLLFLDLNQNDSVVTEREIWPRAPQLGVMISNWKGKNNQPADTQLISALKRILPENRIVSQLVSKLDENYVQKRSEFPGNIETKLDLLNELNDVRIGIE